MIKVIEKDRQNINDLNSITQKQDKLSVI